MVMAYTATWGISSTLQSKTITTTSTMTTTITTALDQRPSMLVLNINGQIDRRLVYSVQQAIQDKQFSILVIHMTSEGGWNTNTEYLGAFLRSIEHKGVWVIFYVEGYCFSGCYLLSTFANQIVMDKDSLYGFRHTFEQVKNDFLIYSVMVYTNRGLTEMQFRATMNQTFTEAEASQLGLIDGVENWNNFISQNPQAVHVTVLANQKLGEP